MFEKILKVMSYMEEQSLDTINICKFGLKTTYKVRHESCHCRLVKRRGGSGTEKNNSR